MKTPALTLLLLLWGCAPPVQVRSSPSSTPTVRFGPSGRPEGPHLLVSDQATQSVALIDLGGRVVQRYAVDGTPGGVTHDREEGAGFWVCLTTPSSEAPVLTFIGWSGEILDQFSESGGFFRGCRGLDMQLTEEHGPMLALVTRNSNAIDVLGGMPTRTHSRYYETSFHDQVFLEGYWGVHLFPGPYDDATRLSTHRDGRIERWRWSTFGNFRRDIPVAVPRGITRAPDGRLFIVDAESARVVVFSAEDGNMVGEIRTPDTSPAGISYSE